MEFSRRQILKVSLGGLAALSPGYAEAENSCGPMGCLAQVSFSQFSADYQAQFQSEWCWAACISMLFGYYGHPVSQQRIVTEAYGAPYNMPAGSGFTIAGALNRSWTDDDGQSFQSYLEAAFDVQAGVAAINSVMIIQALADGDPLIVGARGHATVVTAVSYVPTPAGPHIVQVGVFDPWPGRGPRNLTVDEMTPLPLGGSLGFLALARIS
jgi:Papain-like cysteine protease AvrRpt2